MQYITNKKIGALQKMTLTFMLLAMVIGGTLSPINIQITLAAPAQQPVVFTPPPVSAFDALPDCVTFVEFSFTGCLAVASYYIFFYIPSAILAIVGEIFNITVAFSISSEVYDSEFVREGWGIVRNLANITFIFILLYIAISTILRLGTINTRQALVNVIIIAFLVNFSLFFTQIVIDAGNITAGYVYNAITAPAPTTIATKGTVPTKNISVALVAGFEPQNLIHNKNFGEAGTPTTNMALVMVFLAGGIISIITIWALGWAALIFLVRIPVLWLVMIGAPFAFVAWILSGTQSFSRRWLHMLINQSFVAAIFLFFMYLIIRFIVNAKFLDDAFAINAATNSITAVIVTVLFKAAILIALLIMAVKVAKGLSQNIAGSAVDYANKGFRKAGLVRGVKRIQRGAVAIGAGMLARSETLQEAATKTGMAGAAARGVLYGAGKQYEPAEKAKIKRRVDTARFISRGGTEEEKKAKLEVYKEALGAGTVLTTGKLGIIGKMTGMRATEEGAVKELEKIQRRKKVPGLQKERRAAESKLEELEKELETNYQLTIDEQAKLKKSISDQKDIMRKKQNAVDEIDASEDLAEQVAQKLKQEGLGGIPSGDNKEK